MNEVILYDDYTRYYEFFHIYKHIKTDRFIKVCFYVDDDNEFGKAIDAYEVLPFEEVVISFKKKEI